MKPEELARLHPRLGERMARDSDSIRSRLEEARRLNMDELRELQRFAAYQSLFESHPCTYYIPFLFIEHFVETYHPTISRLQMMKEREERMSPDSEWIARQQAMRDHLPENYDKDDVQKRIEEVS